MKGNLTGGYGLQCLYVLLIAFTCLLSACRDTAVSPAVPNVPVNIQLNVSSLQYPELRRDGGYVYLNGGYKGILLVRQNAATYLAFERACPYHPTEPCALVEVDESNLFIVDDCCGSQFNFSGQVTSGPAAYGLKQYATALSGSILYITN